MATASVWMPKRYSMTEDFELWTRRFESYCKAAKVADGVKCDVLLAALDDDAFRAVDALGLSDEVRNGYSNLMVALKERFSPTTCKFELRFRLRRCIQQEGKSFDDFAGALTRQGNRALLILNLKLAQKLYEISLLKEYGTATYKSAYFRMPLVH